MELKIIARPSIEQPLAVVSLSGQADASNSTFELRRAKSASLAKPIPKSLSEDQIREAARKFYEIYGRLPNTATKEAVPNMPYETWSGINQAGSHGYRGLTQGRPLREILKPLRLELQVEPARGDKKDLSEDQIREAARKFYEIHSRLPTTRTEEVVPDMPYETWSIINDACRHANRGLTRITTLAQVLQPLRNELKLGPNQNDKKDLSEDQIISAAREFYRIHHKIPTEYTNEAVPGLPHETWTGINSVGRDGHRGLTKGRPLREILKPLRKELGLGPGQGEKDDLSEDQIREAARKFYKLHDRLPTCHDTDEAVPEMPHETWAGINQAGSAGYRGLTKGRPLREILKPLRKELGLGPGQGEKDDLSEDQIREAARKFYKLHDRLPTCHDTDEAVPEMPHETWAGINQAGSAGYRGLTKGRPLREILKPLRKELGLGLGRGDKEYLSEDQIREAARKFYEFYGRLPTAATKEAPLDILGTTWDQINAAARYGNRGLTKGGSLSVILAPLRDQLNSYIGSIRLPGEFNQIKKMASGSSRNLRELSSSFQISQLSKFAKGEAFEQIAGIMLASIYPDELIIPQYCLQVNEGNGYYGLRADYKVGSHIYEIKWGGATDNILETDAKHRAALAATETYHLLLLNPNVDIKVPHSLFEQVVSGSSLREDLLALVTLVKDLAESGATEDLRTLRDYFYGLVMSANKYQGQKRLKLIQERLREFNSQADKIKYASQNCTALYSPLEAHFYFRGDLYRALITPKALCEDDPGQYSRVYKFDQLRFINEIDRNIAVMSELGNFDGHFHRAEDFLGFDEDDNFMEPIFCLPDGRTVCSRASQEEADIVIDNLDDLRRIFNISDEDFSFGQKYIEAEG